MEQTAIAIANQKGGCGKTTTAVNLSAGLALKSYKVLLIDLDPQGAATTGLGINKWTIEKTIYNVLLDEEVSIQDVVRAVDPQGLDVVPATLDLSAASMELLSQPGREKILATKLRQISGVYDYVILDTPPSLDLLTMNALVAAKHVLIPVQTEYYALVGLTHLLSLIDKIQERLDVHLDVAYLLTMFDRRTKLSKEVEDEVHGHAKGKVFKTYIPRNVALAEAPSHGKPIQLYAPDSAGAQAYAQLVEEVIQDAW